MLLEYVPVEKLAYERRIAMIPKAMRLLAWSLLLAVGTARRRAIAV